MQQGRATVTMMQRISRLAPAVCLAVGSALAGAGTAAEKPFEPVVGQEGKDVVWVPTPPALVEKMLDMAKVTPRDFVMDLGSGDGRNVIAAARRGARALGVEYNLNMVELSERLAEKEGVAGKAKFVQGDMYEADISQATVLALFLLTENLNRLTPKFLELKPGSRIVVNGFTIDGWEADETGRADGDCGSWCTAYLYIVPARVAGKWRLPQGELTLEQRFQKVTGALNSKGASVPVTDGRLFGDRLSFTVDGVAFTGSVTGDAMHAADGTWRATRMSD
ncbi:MAG: methyltransferase domain-containing protein [Burkholderiales bacterium]|nr:methyltransferase domain-containing protein [Burkholderiales bacterium]